MLIISLSKSSLNLRKNDSFIFILFFRFRITPHPLIRIIAGIYMYKPKNMQTPLIPLDKVENYSPLPMQIDKKKCWLISRH